MTTPRKVLILGANSTLGSMLVSILARDPLLEVQATVRSTKILRSLEATYPNVRWRLFDVGTSCHVDLNIETLPVCDWYINAISLGKNSINEHYSDDRARAVTINTLFPIALDRFIARIGGHLLLPGTSGVFSGLVGNLDENTTHDPHDIYGKTRSLGELRTSTTSVLRTISLEFENGGNLGLIDWMRSQPHANEIRASSVATWNGVTSLHLAKVMHGIIIHRPELKELHHLIPQDSISNYQLLELLKHLLKRTDLTIVPAEGKTQVNTLLTTLDPGYNKLLWALAGYNQGAPTIKQMVEEFLAYTDPRITTADTPLRPYSLSERGPLNSAY